MSEKVNYYSASISDLLDLIEKANQSIERHRGAAEPNPVVLEGFERLRQQYLDQLNEIFAEFGFQLRGEAMAA